MAHVLSSASTEQSPLSLPITRAHKKQTKVQSDLHQALITLYLDVKVRSQDDMADLEDNDIDQERI